MFGRIAEVAVGGRGSAVEGWVSCALSPLGARGKPSFGEGSKRHILGGIEVTVKVLVVVAELWKLHGQVLVCCCCGFFRFGLGLFFVVIVAAAPEHDVGRGCVRRGREEMEESGSESEKREGEKREVEETRLLWWHVNRRA
jgi:hypothetical protein